MSRINSRNDTVPNAPFTGNIRWGIWRGQLQPLLTDGLISHRLGTAGDDVETFGKRAKLSTIDLMSYATSQEALDQALADVVALKHKTVKCRDARGKLWLAVLIEDVTIVTTRQTPPGHAALSGGSLVKTSHILEVQMMMRVQPDT